MITGVAAPDTIRVTAEHERADRARDEAHREGDEGQKQGNELGVSREERAGDGDCEDAVSDEIVNFEQIADCRGGEGLALDGGVELGVGSSHEGHPLEF